MEDVSGDVDEEERGANITELRGELSCEIFHGKREIDKIVKAPNVGGESAREVHGGEIDGFYCCIHRVALDALPLARAAVVVHSPIALLQLYYLTLQGPFWVLQALLHRKHNLQFLINRQSHGAIREKPERGESKQREEKHARFLLTTYACVGQHTHPVALCFSSGI